MLLVCSVANWCIKPKPALNYAWQSSFLNARNKNNSETFVYPQMFFFRAFVVRCSLSLLVSVAVSLYLLSLVLLFVTQYLFNSFVMALCRCVCLSWWL